MARSVEEVRVPERDVLRRLAAICAAMSASTVARSIDEEPAAVDRRNRAVPAHVADSRVTSRCSRRRAARPSEHAAWRSVAAVAGACAAGRKRQLGERHRRDARRRRALGAREAIDERDQLGLVLASEHRVGAARAQVGLVERRVQAEEAHVGARVQVTHAGGDAHTDAQCRVHRHRDSDEVRVADQLVIEVLEREILGDRGGSRRARETRAATRAHRLVPSS